MVQVISGALKNYEWGSDSGLRPWTDGPAPLAELWFGVHPSGVSPLVDSPHLLDSVFNRSDAPILVKLLSAAKPLSIQVHPSTEFAQLGFRELNNEGAFADEFEKTELLYALTDFLAFVGWRNFSEVVKLFGELSVETGINFFPENSDRTEAFSHLVRNAPHIPNIDAVVAAIPAALTKLEPQFISEDSYQAYDTVVREYPADAGVLLSLFLDVLRLQPGESVYVPAGVPHSYIEGTGIEVMTASDNVLRLGMTPKPVFPELALQALDFDAAPNAGVRPFNVEVISASVDTPEEVVLDTGNYRLVLAVEGAATIDNSVHIQPGQAAVMKATEPPVTVKTSGMMALVTDEPTSSEGSK